MVQTRSAVRTPDEPLGPHSEEDLAGLTLADAHQDSEEGTGVPDVQGQGSLDSLGPDPALASDSASEAAEEAGVVAHDPHPPHTQPVEHADDAEVEEMEDEDGVPLAAHVTEALAQTEELSVGAADSVPEVEDFAHSRSTSVTAPITSLPIRLDGSTDSETVVPAPQAEGAQVPGDAGLGAADSLTPAEAPADNPLLTELLASGAATTVPAVAMPPAIEVEQWEDSGSDDDSSDSEEYITAAAAFGNRSLGDSLQVHVSDMERARDQALQRNEPRVSARGLRCPDADVGPLELRRHVSELERAKEAAQAANEPRVPARSALTAAGLGDVSGSGPAMPSLDALPIHKSRLEQEKEAAVALGDAAEPRISPRRLPRGEGASLPPGMPSLDALPIHKSRLEREKEAAAAAAASKESTKSSPARPKTALQREREAAAKLAKKAARQAKREAAAAAVETV